MTGWHLPISDQLRAWFFKALGILVAALAIPMLLLNLMFCRTGSLQPDVATQRVYPMQEHGTLFVVAWQGELAIGLFWAAVAAAVLAIIVNPYRGRFFLLKDE